MENIPSVEIRESKEEYQKNEASLILLSNPKPIADITTESQNFLKYHGFFFGMLSAFCLSLSSVFNKSAQLTTGSEQAFIRYIIQVLTMGIIIMFTKQTFLGPKELRNMLILRGSMSTLALLASHFALKLINPSDAVALLNLNTILLSIMARFILKEKMNLVHLICLILSMFGVVFIAQPSFIFQSQAKENEAVKISDKELYSGISIGMYFIYRFKTITVNSR